MTHQNKTKQNMKWKKGFPFWTNLTIDNMLAKKITIQIVWTPPNTWMYNMFLRFFIFIYEYKKKKIKIHSKNIWRVFWSLHRSSVTNFCFKFCSGLISGLKVLIRLIRVCLIIGSYTVKFVLKTFLLLYIQERKRYETLKQIKKYERDAIERKIFR